MITSVASLLLSALMYTGTGPKTLAEFVPATTASHAPLVWIGVLFSRVVWSVLVHELFFRAGVQRLVGRYFAREQARKESFNYDDGTVVFVQDWRSSADDLPRRRARLASSLSSALAHVPYSGPGHPELLLAACPGVLAAGFTNHWCFAFLYERRGLAAALGAHAMHNLLVICVHASSAAIRRTGSGSRLLGPLLPRAGVVLYSCSHSSLSACWSDGARLPQQARGGGEAAAGQRRDGIGPL